MLLVLYFSKCWVFSIGMTRNLQDHNIPMETTTLGTIFELYLMITFLQSIATILVIYFQGICINMIIYFRLPLDPLQVKKSAQE